MFSFFKKDNVQKELDDNTNSFQEVISVICIMLEISRLDGKIDANENRVSKCRLGEGNLMVWVLRFFKIVHRNRIIAGILWPFIRNER